MENIELKSNLFPLMETFEKTILGSEIYFSIAQKQVIIEMIFKMFPDNYQEIAQYIHNKSLEEKLRRFQN